MNDEPQGALVALLQVGRGAEAACRERGDQSPDAAPARGPAWPLSA
jgi:hypothetical protein